MNLVASMICIIGFDLRMAMVSHHIVIGCEYCDVDG